MASTLVVIAALYLFIFGARPAVGKERYGGPDLVDETDAPTEADTPTDAPTGAPTETPSDAPTDAVK